MLLICWPCAITAPAPGTTDPIVATAMAAVSAETQKDVAAVSPFLPLCLWNLSTSNVALTMDRSMRALASGFKSCKGCHAIWYLVIILTRYKLYCPDDYLEKWTTVIFGPVYTCTYSQDKCALLWLQFISGAGNATFEANLISQVIANVSSYRKTVLFIFSRKIYQCYFCSIHLCCALTVGQRFCNGCEMLDEIGYMPCLLLGVEVTLMCCNWLGETNC